jgi:hypothetical protein
MDTGYNILFYAVLLKIMVEKVGQLALILLSNPVKRII